MTQSSASDEPLSPELNELIRLPNERARDVFIDAHPALLDAASVARLAHEVRFSVHIDPGRATMAGDAAVALARRLGDPRSLGYGLRAKANALFGLNHLHGSLPVYEESAQSFLADGDDREAGRTLLGAIQSLILVGRYGEALSMTERVRAHLERAGDEEALSWLENNRGNVYHRTGRFEEALRCYEASYHKMVPFKDGQAIGAALSNLAVCLIALNDFERALAAYARARAHCEEHGLHRLVVRADYNIAYLYFLRGRYGEALERLRATAHRFRADGDTYHASLCDLDLSDIYLELNSPRLAVELAEAAEAGFSALGTTHELGRAIVNQAIALGQLSRSADAIARFLDGRSLFEKEGSRAWVAVIDLQHATVLFRANRLFEARKRARSALEFFEESGQSVKAAWARNFLARLALSAGDVKLAHVYCRRAERELASYESPLLAFQAQQLRAEISEAAGNIPDAFSSYERAAERLELLRGTLHWEELKMAFMKDKLSVYESLVALELARASPPSATNIVGWIERAKSRALSEYLDRSHRGARSAGSRDTGGDGLQSLREELNWYYHRLELEELRDDATAETVNSLRSRTDTLEKRILQQLRDRKSAAGETFAAKGSEPKSTGEIQTHLGDAALIEFYETRGELVVAVLSRQSVMVRTLGPLAPVKACVERLTFQLYKVERTAPSGEAYADYGLEVIRHHLEWLYGALIAPLRRDLAVRHIVFVPYGVLHQLPFHALFDGERFLIDDFTISYAPSASIFASCQADGRRPVGPPLVMAVPDARNPFIEREAGAVAEVLPGSRVRLGADACLAALRDEAGGSSILHIASHGYFRADSPMFSAVRLGDGYLTLPDLYSLDLDVGARHPERLRHRSERRR